MCYVCVCVLETQKLTCVNMCATCVHNFLNEEVSLKILRNKYGRIVEFVRNLYGSSMEVVMEYGMELVWNDCGISMELVRNKYGISWNNNFRAKF